MNLFNGLDGHSDGKQDGPSEPIVGNGADKNVFVGGTFDGARVILQKYSSTRGDFFPTEGVWTTQNVFIDLSVKVGEQYRLNIENAGASTDLFGEVS